MTDNYKWLREHAGHAMYVNHNCVSCSCGEYGSSREIGEAISGIVSTIESLRERIGALELDITKINDKGKK